MSLTWKKNHRSILIFVHQKRTDKQVCERKILSTFHCMSYGTIISTVFTAAFDGKIVASGFVVTLCLWQQFRSVAVIRQCYWHHLLLYLSILRHQSHLKNRIIFPLYMQTQWNAYSIWLLWRKGQSDEERERRW